MAKNKQLNLLNIRAVPIQCDIVKMGDERGYDRRIGSIEAEMMAISMK